MHLNFPRHFNAREQIAVCGGFGGNRLAIRTVLHFK